MATNTPVNDQAPLEPRVQAEECTPVARAMRPQRLDWLHTQAAGAFLGEPSPAVETLAAEAARGLAIGTDRERSDARIRLAACMITSGRTQLQTLELALAAAVNRGDEKGAALISKTLDGVSRRLAVWLQEHRLSCSSSQRSVSVAIGSAGQVAIVGEK